MMDLQQSEKEVTEETAVEDVAEAASLVVDAEEAVDDDTPLAAVAVEDDEETLVELEDSLEAEPCDLQLFEQSGELEGDLHPAGTTDPSSEPCYCGSILHSELGLAPKHPPIHPPTLHHHHHRN